MKKVKVLLSSLVPGFAASAWKSFKQRLAFKKRLFRIFEKFGWHLIPVHYYSPLPDTRELMQNRQHWDQETDFSKINFNTKLQSELNQSFIQFHSEFDLLPSFADIHSQGFGPGYGEIEAYLLYSFIRHYKPRKMIEVGSGVSTLYSSKALSVNKKEGSDASLICIEPYPLPKLYDVPLVNEIIVKKVQDVELGFFQTLNENDILFLDSSHAVKIGSDVNYLILDVLPSLKKGVIIHIHDIPFPYLYPYPDIWIFERHIFWQEAVLLKAFLINNHEFEIMYSSSYLHFKNPDELKKTFPVYDKTEHFPASVWLRKIL